MAYNPDDFAQGAGILTEANDYMDAAVKILRRDLGQRVAAPSKTVEHLTNSATLVMFPGWARRPATDAQLP